MDLQGRGALLRVARRWARIKVPMVLVGLALLAGVQPPFLRAQVRPDEEWRSMRTEHFRVTFPRNLEALGRRAAARAERAWQELSEGFVDPPAGTIDLLVTDHTDLSNGFASVTPSNRITVFASPPVGDYSLGYFDDWMELVITHELAHIFHLDRTGAVGKVLRSVFGRVSGPWPYFPETGLPRWTIEGLATWYESRYTGAGRVRGSYHEMLLRTAAIEGRFENLGQASGNSPVWPSGTRAYAYGALFFDHLLKEHGEEAMGAFAEAVAGQWVPYRLDAAARHAFGTTVTEEWKAWREGLIERYGDLESDLSRRMPVTHPQRLTRGARVGLYPAVSPDGSRLVYARADGNTDTQLRAASPDGSASSLVTRTNGLATFAWMPDGALLSAQFDFTDPYSTYRDLYVTDARGRSRRITRGARLEDPGVSADGSLVVAVQQGEGTNRLVRVDLASGRVTPFGGFDLDVHWAYPRPSPDGHWIAVSRWSEGAYFDVVILDAAGEVVGEVTRDRAIDLAPAWTPGGRWIVWSSDRTGIPNLMAARIDSASGRPGPVRQVTNVLTGAAYPSVDPAGRWIYLSGYHVDGWEIERVPFEPDSWIDAPAPAARFQPPRDPGIVQAGEFQGAVRGYSPLPTLLPRYWKPILKEPRWTSAVRTDELFLRSRKLLGYAAGAETSGRDMVGRHGYSAFARVYSSVDRADWGFNYSYAGLGNPILGFAADQFWSEEGPRLARREEGAPLDTLFVLERERSASLSTRVLRNRWRNAAAVTLSGGLVWEHRVLLDNDLEKTGQYRLTRPDTRLWDFRVSLRYSTARSHAFELGAADGVSLFVQGRTRYELALPDSLRGEVGRDRSVDDLIGRVRAYRSLGGPGFSRHVLALRVAVGAARGPNAGAGHFDVGGAPGTSETVTGLRLFKGYSFFFPVRGYDNGNRFGSRAWSVAAEYRLPLWLVNRGAGAWPLYVDRLVGAVFFDAGNAWGPELGVKGFQNPRRGALASAGGELISSILTFWRSPLTVRTGVALPLTEGRGARFYARVGMIF